MQFDFLDDRTLTGIKTIGSEIGRLDAPETFWVKAYKVTYSHDGKAWNPILINGGQEKVFSHVQMLYIPHPEMLMIKLDNTGFLKISITYMITTFVNYSTLI